MRDWYALCTRVPTTSELVAHAHVRATVGIVNEHYLAGFVESAPTAVESAPTVLDGGFAIRGKKERKRQKRRAAKRGKKERKRQKRRAAKMRKQTGEAASQEVVFVKAIQGKSTPIKNGALLTSRTAAHSLERARPDTCVHLRCQPRLSRLMGCHCLMPRCRSQLGCAMSS